ncbi:hypothetical protein V6N13_113721 [Hibiscus sabdariffa]|uniref:Uncharacterized protein n=1 Tax=Hibiscus sabdariffa TaxID=183260 RepID=A0ABR2TZP4_9ROSI
MGENIAPQNHAEEAAAEEAFSLGDFLLDSDAKNNPENDHSDSVKVPGLGLSRRSSSEAAPEFFEFLSDLSYDMCPADDIIFCGKLIPLNEQPIPFQTSKDYSFEQDRKNHVLHKRSESFSELLTRSDSTKEYTKRLRNSRSLDYKKLRRYDMERNPSTRSTKKPEASAIKVNKRRWYVFMLGTVKFPPEMELKDIKSRQFRRNPSVMFPTVEDYGKRHSGNRSSGKGSSWSLLKALSCRDHSSVAVATSLWMPQA